MPDKVLIIFFFNMIIHQVGVEILQFGPKWWLD